MYLMLDRKQLMRDSSTTIFIMFSFRFTKQIKKHLSHSNQMLKQVSKCVIDELRGKLNVWKADYQGEVTLPGDMTFISLGNLRQMLL